MKRNSLFTKAIALLVCAIMLIGYLPSIALPVAANDFESDIDVVETTEAPTEAPGSSEASAIFLGALENTLEVEGTVYYYGNFNGTTMTVTGEGEFSVIVGGEATAAVDGKVEMAVTTAGPRDPFIFAISGNGTYQANFAYPAGHMNNPEALELGYNDVSLAAGNQQEYHYYTWTAAADGDLSFEISSITEGVEADIVINNITTYANKTLLADGVVDDFGNTVVTMPVNAGDEISIQVVVVPDADWNVAAAEITHYSAFTYPLGSEQNPILLTEQENTVTNAGTLYYQGYFSGMIMTVTGADAVIYNGETVAAEEGVVELAVSSPNPRMPVSFGVVGDGEVDIDFAYPAGHQMKPDTAVLGDNVANIEAGATEYYWNYTAEKDGALLVGVSSPDGNWQYTVNNLTTGSYGDTQWSDSDPVVNPTVINVAAGNVIEIKVITYDPADMWNIPEGTITINLAYCEHTDVTTTTTPATCTEPGVETVVCNVCGNTTTTEIPALGHDYTGENGACVNCGEYQVDETLVFFNKAMVLGADIRGIFQVRKYKSTSPYESFKVIVEKGGVETELELVATSDKTSYTTYGYAITVPAKEMADVVNATIIGIKADGTYCVSNPDTWSIKEGVIAIMDSNATKTDEASVNKMKLCANMLNYGAEAQKKFSYNLDNLATDGLSDAYAAYIITTTPEMNVIDKTDDSGVAAPLKDIVFNLAARVQVLPRFTVPKADAKESYKAVVNQIHVAPDGTETVYDTVVIEGADCLKSGSTFAVYIDYLAAKELRDVITITLYKGDVQVSATHTFSAESVLSGLMSSYPTLIPALMNFCDCARAVFN